MAELEGAHDQQAIWSKVARERDAIIAGHLVPLWHAMLDTVGAGAGVRFLDAGCGSGGASELAIARGADVTGVDLSEQMIAVCREKPALAAAKLYLASLEALPFADASFEAAMASMVIHFCPDPAQALRELRRVVAPGGRLAVSSPSSPDVDVVIAFKVAAELRPEDARDILRPLTFAPSGTLVAALQGAGFEHVTETYVDTTMGPTSFEAIWTMQKNWAPIGTTVARVGEQRFLDAYLPRIQHCFAGDRVTMSSAYRVASAVR